MNDKNNELVTAFFRFDFMKSKQNTNVSFKETIEELAWLPVLKVSYM